MTTDRIRRLSREGIWLASGQAAAVGGALIGVRVLTELLDPAAYGQLALGMTVAALINQTVLGPLGNGATRFYAPAQEQGDISGYLKAIRHLLRGAAGIIGLIVFIAITGLAVIDRTDLAGITVAALTFALVSGCNSILSGMQNAARQRSVVALHQGAESWMRFVVAAALMLTLHASSAAAMWGYVLASMLILVSQYRFFQKSLHDDSPAQETDWATLIWNYSWPFGTWGIFTWLQLASDRWALEQFATSHEVGLYVVLYQLGYYPISMATGIAVQFLAPIVYQRAGDAKDSQRNGNVNRLTWQLTALALALTCAASLLAAVFHRQIFTVFVSQEYGSVSSLLPLVTLSGGIFAAGQTMALNLMSMMKTRAMVGAKIGSALLGIAFNFAGVYWYGTTGVVVAGVLFSVSYCAWMVMLSRQVQKSSQIELNPETA